MTPEAVEAVLEAPAKRSRRDPVKKTPVKSVKKATPPAKKSRYLDLFMVYVNSKEQI